jgi:hypothetical protein
MCDHTIIAALLLGLIGVLPGREGRADDSNGDPIYLVGVWDRRVILERYPDSKPTNLAPALIATKDAGGVLVKADLRGKYVIEIPAAKLPEAHNSHAVRSISEVVPKETEKITELKLSYRKGEQPSPEALRKLALEIVKDEPKLSFMVVRPVDGRIDAALAERLEGCPQITYVTPVHRIRAI